MELETLEVLLDINLEHIEEKLSRVMPQINKVMSSVEQITGNTMNKTEKNLDVEKGTNKITKQLKEMNDNFVKQMKMMEVNSEKSSENVGKNMSKGFTKARSQVGKDVDAIVTEINSKMGQAKAQQEKMAFLKSQRQGSVDSGDTKGTVKYDEQIANAEAAMQKYHSTAKALANNIKAEFDSIPGSLDSIGSAMDKNEAKIETMRANLKNLQSVYADQKTPTGNFEDGFSGSKDSKSSLKTLEKIQKQATLVEKLMAENDKLGESYAQLEDRAGPLQEALSKINTELGQTQNYDNAKKTAKAASKNVSRAKAVIPNVSSGGGGGSGNGSGPSNALKSVGNNADSVKNKILGMGNIFNRTADNMSRNGRKMQTPFVSMNRVLNNFVRRLLVAGLAYKAFSGMASYIGKAVMVNDQFSKSLNEIKINLATAFYPIYQSIMPALNALMSWLSTATAYLASFIATLFGTTFQAAKQGASTLNNSIATMGETGDAAETAAKKAKKLQRALMGFDEINRIGLDDDSDVSSLDSKPSKAPGLPNGMDFSIPDPGIPKWVNTLANKVKQILADLFKPIKAAWDKQGKRVMDALKYSLKEVWGLVKAIGNSFMEVWTNGTGQRFVENLLILLGDVLYIVGDIAKAFKDAWNDEGRGTALIQSLFDMLNGVLVLLHNIAESFRNAWNDGTGQEIAANLLEIFTNIFDTIGNLADQFSVAWKTAGVGDSIMSGILGIINIVLETINKMTKATADWAKTLDFTPLLNSIDGLLKAIQPLTQNIGDGLLWFYENVLLPLASFTIEDLIPAFIDLLSGAIEVLNSVIDALKPLGQWLWDSFLQPLASWTGAIIIDAINSLTKALKGVSDWIKKHQKTVETFTIIIGSFAAAFMLLKGALVVVGVVKSISSVITIIGTLIKSVGLVQTAITFLAPLIGALSWPIVLIGAAIGAVIAIGVLLWKNWDEISQWATEKWDAIKETVSGAVEGTKKAISEKWDAVKQWTSDTWESVKKNTGEAWENVKTTVSDKAQGIYDDASTKFTNLKNNSSIIWDAFKKDASDKWEGTKASIGDKAKNIYDDTSTKFTNLKNNSALIFDTLKSEGSNKWEEIKNNIGDKANTAKDRASTAWSNMKDNMGGYAETIKSTASSAFDNVANWAGDMGNRIGKGFQNGVDAVKRGAKSIANGIVSVIGGAVNGVINGINWILDKVGAGGSKLGNWEVPTYASGTNSHPGGAALVNDGQGSKWQEAYQLPTGETGLFPRVKNMLVDLPKGTKVMSGTKTDSVLGGKVPAYANGIGDWISEKWQGAKEMASDIWSYASDPSKLMKLAISKFTNLTNALDPALSIAKGAIGTISTGAMDMVKKKLDEGSESPVGTGAERWRPVITKALSMNGLPTSDNYVGAWLRQVQSESGGNEKAVQGGYVDVNTLSGDLAKGLLQTISATFNAYKFPGKGNIFNGFHNSLAAINYAKSRYGASSMLGVIGHGHGYENGGRINKEGMYRLGEGNKDEMIIPLTRPNRAMDLINQALEFMGIDSDFSSLQLPEILRNDSTSFTNSSQNRNQNNGFDMSEFKNMGDSLISAVMMALQSQPQSNNQNSGPIEITMQVDADQFGKVAIKGINKAQEKAGVTLINL